MLREQKACKLKGSIYHRTQIDLTYNSNHIEGSRLTKEHKKEIPSVAKLWLQRGFA